MPWVTEFEVSHPGKEPVTLDKPMRSPRGNAFAYGRNGNTGMGALPYKTVTDFSPLYGAMSPGLEGNLGQIEFITNLARQIAKATGIIDPITYYEGQMPLPDVFKKYSGDVDYYKVQIQGVPAPNKVKDPMLEKLKGMEELRNKIAPAFQPGAAMGQADRDRLADLVFNMRQWRKEWNDMTAQYGQRPIATPPGVPAQPKVGTPVAQMGFGDILPWALGGLLIYGLFFGKKK